MKTAVILLASAAASVAAAASSPGTSSVSALATSSAASSSSVAKSTSAASSSVAATSSSAAKTSSTTSSKSTSGSTFKTTAKSTTTTKTTTTKKTTTTSTKKISLGLNFVSSNIPLVPTPKPVDKSRFTTSNKVTSLSWKAGLSGFPTIETLPIFQQNFLPYISWYSNYNPVAPNFVESDHTVIGAPMLWGKGDQCLTGPDGPVDLERFTNFTAFVAPPPLPLVPMTAAQDPAVFFGFYEPDCNCSSSSHIPVVDVGVVAWDLYIKPLSKRGIPLGSPPMCTQLDQFWLTDFAAAGVTWDITSVHVNKPTVAEGIAVVEYYWKKFGKPVWVSELTCVTDHDWTSCGDQTTVNNYIDGMVTYLEKAPYVIAYGANTGEGVPGVWNLFNDSTWPPTLTATGTHYLNVLKYLRTV